MRGVEIGKELIGELGFERREVTIEELIAHALQMLVPLRDAFTCC